MTTNKYLVITQYDSPYRHRGTLHTERHTVEATDAQSACDIVDEMSSKAKEPVGRYVVKMN